MLPATPPAAPATPAPVTPTPAPVAPATPPARTRNPWPWIILGIVAFLALCLICSTITGLSYWWMTRATPAAVPTALYAPPVLPIPTTPAVSASTCTMTTEQAKSLTGVDVQRIGTEPCTWVWRGVPPASVTAKCPSGFECTWDVVNDITVVHLGVDQSATIHAGTWRFLEGFPSNDAVHDICALYQKEKAFGLSEVPSFQVRFQAVQNGAGVAVGPQSCP